MLGLLEQARKGKQIGSSLEAEVDIIIPDNVVLEEVEFLATLQREGSLLPSPSIFAGH